MYGSSNQNLPLLFQLDLKILKYELESSSKGMIRFPLARSSEWQTRTGCHGWNYIKICQDAVHLYQPGYCSIVPVIDFEH